MDGPRCGGGEVQLAVGDGCWLPGGCCAVGTVARWWLGGWLVAGWLVAGGWWLAGRGAGSYSADSRALDGVGSLSGVELARAVVPLAGATK